MSFIVRLGPEYAVSRRTMPFECAPWKSGITTRNDRHGREAPVGRGSVIVGFPCLHTSRRRTSWHGLTGPSGPVRMAGGFCRSRLRSIHSEKQSYRTRWPARSLPRSLPLRRRGKPGAVPCHVGRKSMVLTAGIRHSNRPSTDTRHGLAAKQSPYRATLKIKRVGRTPSIVKARLVRATFCSSVPPQVPRHTPGHDD